MSTLSDRPGSPTKRQEIGTVTYHFPVLDSTNTYALKLLSQIRPKAGTIIRADYQTAGRGQFGRGWHSAPGLNLCLTCILSPTVRAHDQFQLNMAIALAVLDTVGYFVGLQDLKIKWPNDIYMRDKKIAGLLIQNSIQGNVMTSSIAGIGLNVNETEFPAWIPNPTSLKLEMQKSKARTQNTNSHSLITDDETFTIHAFDLDMVLAKLTNYLQNRIALPGVDVSRLRRDYQGALYGRGILSKFRIPATEALRTGTIVGVDEQGRLMIRWENGEMGVYQHREIEYL